MKFLHLADLHIGKSVNSFTMLGEQRHAFDQIIGHIQKERPAAVVVAGDVYDRAVPGTEAVRLFDDFLTELSREDVSVMVVSGNHDSPERLSYASRLLSDKGIHICGAFCGSLQKVALADEHGSVNFWLLPFIKPSSVQGVLGGIEIESYDEAVRAAVEASGIDYSERNVLVSHQFYTLHGAAPVRSDSELNPVGGLDAVSSKIIMHFDYAALGHLHSAQSAGLPHVRFAGAPVKYSFSEMRQEKSVTLVEIGKKGDLSTAALALRPLHDMREIKGSLEMLTGSEALALADKEDYLRVVLTDEEEIIDPLGKLRSVYPNIMSLGFENSRTRVDIAAIAAGAERVERLSAFDLFSEFFLDMQGSAMSKEQADIAMRLFERGGDE
ncbi:MAG: exonuclease SbcCD subunit D [Clostridiales bacterium]|nr:exonuclease SbcCD subunit D [Clostridiales bacterium]